jgi:hypothetical protein
MKVIRLKQNDKYNRQDVVECYESQFVANNTDWGDTPPSWGMALPDDSPVGMGWKYRNGEWDGPQDEHVDDVRVDKRAEIAEARWKAETGGVTAQGMTISTDRDSQALITGAALQATLDPNYTCHWKTGSGFVQLDAQTILGVAAAVRQHVQECFDREAELLAEVAAAETVEDVKAISW